MERLQPPPVPKDDRPSEHPKRNIPRIIGQVIGTVLGVSLILLILFCVFKVFTISVFAGILMTLLIMNAMRINVKIDNTNITGALRYNILSTAMKMLSEAVQLQSKRITELQGIPFGVKNPIQTH